ncbi:unnamed protein product [Mesocestoides corti]|uniref:Groucho/TLE N-terminal Q-rich domain-containing protein n=1 Tax=Mesocestoides corti TaxID=53468 RepID=A0A158QSU9_MESCO|nr:unnamed protein product [Mesocestoides corti]
MEYERSVQEKSELQRHYMMYYEITYGLNIEMHKQTEISKRLGAILAQVIPFLSQEHQAQVAAAVERAKQVTLGELNSIISQLQQQQLLFAGVNPTGGQLGAFPPGLPHPPSSTVNGANALTSSAASGINSLSGNLLSMQGAPPNPFVPPITSISVSSASTTTPSAGAYLGPPTSASPGFPSSNLAQSHSAMAAAMAAMAAAALPTPPTAPAAAFGFPGVHTPTSTPGGVPPNNILPTMMSPAALSALMADKSMDEKQRTAAAAAVAAAMTAAAAQQQSGALGAVDPTAIMATIASMAQSTGGGAGFDLSQTACAAAAAAAAAGVLPPPPPPPTLPGAQDAPPLPNSTPTEPPPRAQSPLINATSPAQPVRASSTLGIIDSKRRRVDGRHEESKSDSEVVTSHSNVNQDAVRDVVVNGASTTNHSPRENGSDSKFEPSTTTPYERTKTSTPCNSGGNRSPVSPTSVAPTLTTPSGGNAASPKATAAGAKLTPSTTPAVRHDSLHPLPLRISCLTHAWEMGLGVASCLHPPLLASRSLHVPKSVHIRTHTFAPLPPPPPPPRLFLPFFHFPNWLFLHKFSSTSQELTSSPIMLFTPLCVKFPISIFFSYPLVT